MTRPTPTQGAQPEAARVPRVSDERLDAFRNFRARIREAEAIDLALDLRDARQASRDKDATIADLERERDYIVGRRQHWEAEACKERTRADALQARLTEAKCVTLPIDAPDYWKATIGSSYTPRVWRKYEASHPTNVARAIAIALQRAPECADTIASLVWQSQLTAGREKTLIAVAEQRAATAERRGFVACRDAAAEIADPPLMHRKGAPGLWRRRRAEIAATIRALAPAVPQEGEMTL